jgi:ABC-type transport system substrate-binding protein|tara:strand:- start:702 stop:1511 length:810 start_codon:yes stop_codon:yes gene_type:complete
MINLITRTNGDPFDTEGNAKWARTWKGLTHTHEVIQHGGGWVLREKQSDANQDGSAVTLQPGDYIATKDLTEDDYHAVAEAFMAAGAGKGEYPSDGQFYPYFGWREKIDNLYHGYNGSGWGERQLTLSQILSATNAGGAVEHDTTTEPTTEEQHMPQQHLADQLEAALSALEHAQYEVDRLQAEYRAAYPKIHGEVVPTEDMSDPANWRAGDVIQFISHGGCFTHGEEYIVRDPRDPDDDDFDLIDDDGDIHAWDFAPAGENFRFVRRP